jgi:phosphomannomutase
MTGESRQLDPTILREYDIRGIVGETLSDADVSAIGRAFGSIMGERGLTKVCVGRDGRGSSPGFSETLAAALAASGMEVLDIGLGPTPMLYFSTFELAADAGMMITGSHNPSEYNGIKIVLQGKSFYGDAIQNLGARTADGVVSKGGGLIVCKEVQAAYVERLARDFIPGREIAVAWDPGNGATGDVMLQLIKLLPGRHEIINEIIDGTFPAHHPDPTVEANLEQLKELVAAKSCDLGIAFDGDGDRIGVVDNQGRVLWGDQLMVLLARDVLTDRPGATIIADVKASQILFDEVARAGGKPLMWKTGHSLIKAKMAEVNAPLAGEMSGHIFFADRYYGFDDAIYAAIRLLSILTRSESSLADLIDGLPKMVNTPEIRFPCAEERKFKVAEEIKSRLAQDLAAQVHTMDGVRVSTEDGWWLLRASNTQAVLVARCEARDAAGLERLKAALTSQLEQSGIAPPDFGGAASH